MRTSLIRIYPGDYSTFTVIYSNKIEANDWKEEESSFDIQVTDLELNGFNSVKVEVVSQENGETYYYYYYYYYYSITEEEINYVEDLPSGTYDIIYSNEEDVIRKDSTTVENNVNYPTIEMCYDNLTPANDWKGEYGSFEIIVSSLDFGEFDSIDVKVVSN